MSVVKRLHQIVESSQQGTPVYYDNEYKVTFENFTNSAGEFIQILLYYNDKVAGLLNTHIIEYDNKKYAKMVGINIEPRHRSKGFGKMMYETLIHYSPDYVVGLISELSKRINHEEIPRIYKRLNAIEEDGFAIIPFNR